MGPRRNYIQKTTGKKVVGVTTPLGVLAKPALLWWAYKQGFTNYEELSQAVAKMLKHQDIEPNTKLCMLMDTLTTFEPLGLYEKRDEAANAGTLAHQMIENHLRKIPLPKIDGMPEAVAAKAKGCYKTFLAWEKSQKVKVVDTEVELTSELMPFGGTIDYIFRKATSKKTDGAVEILDIKTGKDIYLEAKIQVAAYKELWQEHHPDQSVKALHILRLGPNGEFTHKFFPELNPYWEIFKNTLEIYTQIKALGERQ